MSENYKSVWLEGVDFNDEVTGGGSSLSSATRIALAQEVIQEFQVMMWQDVTHILWRLV